MKVSRPVAPREFTWSCSPGTRAKFWRLANRILELQPEDPEVATLEDEARHLPGFPQEARWWDHITIQVQPITRVYSLPSQKVN
jgi:hypothetical protein